jgi:hypothetical protein
MSAINFNGARIAPSSPQEDSRPIELPHQSKPVKHFAMDIGGSLIKLVYFEPSSDETNSSILLCCMCCGCEVSLMI